MLEFHEQAAWRVTLQHLRKSYSRRPTQGGRLELMLRQNSDWAPDRARGIPVRRGAAAAAPLHAGPLGRLRSRRPPSSADTRPLGSASRRGRHGGRVLSCELATLLRYVWWKYGPAEQRRIGRPALAWGSWQVRSRRGRAAVVFSFLPEGCRAFAGGMDAETSCHSVGVAPGGRNSY